MVFSQGKIILSDEEIIPFEHNKKLSMDNHYNCNVNCFIFTRVLFSMLLCYLLSQELKNLTSEQLITAL